LARILAIGAHADDVELGCGGALLAWTRAGHDVTIFVVSDSQYSAPDGRLIRSAEIAKSEAQSSATFIGANLIIGRSRAMELRETDELNSEFLEITDRVSPDIVLTHWDGDTHPDHRVVARTTLHVSRRIPSVLGYASNWYPGSRPFDGRFFVDISETFEDKIKLIELFKSEHERTKGEWTRHARDQARIYGRISGIDYAETFETHKYHLKIG
jgi:LmbE family N-acetylglucosaminyl deacetylase